MKALYIPRMAGIAALGTLLFLRSAAAAPAAPAPAPAPAPEDAPAAAAAPAAPAAATATMPDIDAETRVEGRVYPPGPYGEAQRMLDEQGQGKALDVAKLKGLLEQALQQQPNNAEAHYNLGVAFMRLGQGPKAEDSFRKALQIDPNYADAKARLGMALVHRGAVAEGIDQYIRPVLAADEFHPLANNVLAAQALERAQQERKKTDRDARLTEAITLSRKALLGDPENMNAYLNLALGYYNLPDYQVGLLVCRNAVALNPEAAAIYNVMGLIMLAQDDNKAAIEAFQKAVDTNPGLLEAHMNLGSTTLDFGDFETALKHFDIVIAAQPDNIDAILSRAVALRGLGRFEDARAGYQAVLQKRPDDLRPRYNLCVLLMEYLNDPNNPAAAQERALAQCEDYANRLPKKDPKANEMRSRIKNIKQTLKQLKAMEEMERQGGATPPPAGGGATAPENEPAPPEGGAETPKPDSDDAPAAPEGGADAPAPGGDAAAPPAAEN